MIRKRALPILGVCMAYSNGVFVTAYSGWPQTQAVAVSLAAIGAIAVAIVACCAVSLSRDKQGLMPENVQRYED